jgi:hypothetical protein
VGYTEEEATTKYGADNIDVYHTYFKPLEWSLPGGDVCYHLPLPRCLHAHMYHCSLMMSVVTVGWMVVMVWCNMVLYMIG